MSETSTYRVPGINCGHCRSAITEELSEVAGVTEIDVDIEGKTVTVAGHAAAAEVRAAIEAAGYEVAA